MQTWFSADLHRIEAVSDRLRILHFKPNKVAPLAYQPGQFVKLILSDEAVFQRSYSIGSLTRSHDLSQDLEIAISYVPGGRASKWAFSVQEGITIDVQGPYGQFVLPSIAPKRLWLVATGTGVVPFRSMYYQLQQLAQEQTEINLFVGVRNESELLYLQEWQSLNALPNINCYYCFSQQLPETTLENQFLSRIQPVLMSKSFDLQDDIFYLCGHPEMIDDIWMLLKQRGFSVKQVKREKYVFAAKR